jgi:hypothetical protein
VYRYAVTQQNQLDFVSAEAEGVGRTNYVITVKFSMLTISGSRRAEQHQRCARKDKRGTVHLMRGPFRLWFERSESLLECPLRETHIRRRVGF